MKNSLLLLLSFLLLTGIVSSCTTAKDVEDTTPRKEKFTGRIAENLVAEYNLELLKKYGNEIPFIEKGFVKKGFLESAQMKKSNGRLFQAFMFTEFDDKGFIVKKTRFDFGLDEAVEIPKEIKNAQVLFVGNQLIINNLDNDYQVNLFVKVDQDAINKSPLVQTIEGSYLGIEAVPDNRK